MNGVHRSAETHGKVKPAERSEVMNENDAAL